MAVPPSSRPPARTDPVAPSPQNAASRGPGPLGRRWGREWRERCIHAAFFLCAVLSIVTTCAIVVVLVSESFWFFREVSLWKFLTGTRWAALFAPRSFGVLPLVCGTALVACGAGLIAIPLGVASSLYLSEYASGAFRGLIKPVLEVLAGIPTVVYGYFALVSITPLLRQVFPSTEVFNAASAAIVVGIMILPMIASLCDDAMHSVPEHLRHAGYALGATKLEVSTRIVLPAALSGVLASFVLALSRAAGETAAVYLAAGSSPNLTINPLESIQTMTAYIVQVSLGDTPTGTIEYRSIFAVAMLLFVITLGMNVLAHRVLRRFREVYE